MFETHQVSTPARGRSIFALSVLALLALGCFPLLAQADSSGLQYSDAPPTVTGHTTSNGNEPPAGKSNAHEGGSGGNTGSPGKGSAKGGSSGKPGDGQAAGAGGGKGSQGNGSQNSPGAGGKATGAEAEPASTSSDSGSSPLVPILIAIAVLAAISIGVVVMRQRRRGNDASAGSDDASPSSPVSPEAS